MRILIVEDNSKMAMTMARTLDREGYEIETVGTGIEGERMAISGRFDLVILDNMLPDRDGIEVLRTIRSRGTRPYVLMCSALADRKMDSHAYKSGADGYLSKPFEPEELVVRVRALLRRGSLEHPEILSVEGVDLNLWSRVACRDGVFAELSSKEFALLEFLMRRPHRVLTRDEIGNGVWDTDLSPSSNIIDIYLDSLRKKLDRGSSRKLLTTVKGKGYAFAYTPPSQTLDARKPGAHDPSDTLRPVRVFVASPSDVESERRIVEEVCSELNRTVAHEQQMTLIAMGWEWDTRPQFGGGAQSAIMDQIGDMSRYDLVIGIMWNRFGTPTGSGLTGTQVEFEAAVKSHEQFGRPDIWFYFCKAKSELVSPDQIEQRRQVLSFRDRVQSLGYTSNYQSKREFRDLIRRHLTKWLLSARVSERDHTV